MSRGFEIRREGVLPTSPEEYWDAVTTGNGGWLWPMEFEPRQGGAAPFGGTVTVWDPPHHLVTRVEGADGWLNQLEHVIEGRDGGTTSFRYVHSGIFVDDWENQYDGASQHTDFYLHTLGQYLRYFSRRPVTYVAADAPASSTAPDAFVRLRRELGVADEVGQGDAVRVTLPGIDPLDAVVDYLHPHFLGLRTGDGLYRFFGRNAFGAPIGIALHLFAPGADQAKTTQAWTDWLQDVFA
ncbi:SRPBCC domain-containing protein [Frankia sp. B2]|uniref:SRPBCC family protein n=1 Tax=unclassified Frankia TaxID=2632575 RepID=UPI00046207AC|nr:MULTISPECIES: ATPase [unclassified Frankia]KDA43122.1 hypothetical protein BMG523Draft_01995 [Frankia sp. BMG5.23]ORT47748.1 ATPase [Frankia sp. KB5]TFE33786.1 SRPBCC domain-containing protein [Frankia sp. B2]